jgi:hypothetical protein
MRGDEACVNILVKSDTTGSMRVSAPNSSGATFDMRTGAAGIPCTSRSSVASLGWQPANGQFRVLKLGITQAKAKFKARVDVVLEIVKM